MQKEALHEPCIPARDKQTPHRYLFGWSAAVWAHVALTFVTITFSGMNILVQQALPAQSISSSIGFCFLRDAIAAPVLTVTMLLSKSFTPPRKLDLLKMLMMGIIGMASTQLAFIVGLDFVGGDIAAVFNCFGPSIMFVLSLSLRLERFAWLKVAGVLLGAGGIVFISELWRLSSQNKNLVLGSAILFAGVICAQFFTIIQKYVRGYSSLMVTTVAYWAALASISVVGFFTAYVDGNIWPSTGLEWVAAVYAGVISSALNFWLIVFATNHVSPLIVSLYGPGQSIVTDGLNYVFVGKGFGKWEAVGSVLIFLSLLLTSYSDTNLGTDDAAVHVTEQDDGTAVEKQADE